MTADPVEVGWVPVVDNFGARLALVRQRMRWGNVKEAAESCGLPVQSWRNWERDNGQPRDIVKAAQRISAVSGVNYYWLLDGNAMEMRGPSSTRARRAVPPAAGLRRWTQPWLMRAPGGIRTPNLLIRSQMLYPLSYRLLFSSCASSTAAPKGSS